MSEGGDRWDQIEWEASQRLLGALVARHGWQINAETEEAARVLAFVALVDVKQLVEQTRALNESGSS